MTTAFDVYSAFMELHYTGKYDDMELVLYPDESGMVGGTLMGAELLPENFFAVCFESFEEGYKKISAEIARGA